MTYLDQKQIPPILGVKGNIASHTEDKMISWRIMPALCQ